MIRVLLAAPLLFLLVLFALSNPQPVRLGIWPTDFAIELPLSIAILVAMAASFIIGAAMLWFAAIAAGGRARLAERETRMLDRQVRELQARLAVPTASVTARLPALTDS